LFSLAQQQGCRSLWRSSVVVRSAPCRSSACLSPCSRTSCADASGSSWAQFLTADTEAIAIAATRGGSSAMRILCIGIAARCCSLSTALSARPGRSVAADTAPFGCNCPESGITRSVVVLIHLLGSVSSVSRL